jgi:hypothetical protein
MAIRVGRKLKHHRLPCQEEELLSAYRVDTQQEEANGGSTTFHLLCVSWLQERIRRCCASAAMQR